MFLASCGGDDSDDDKPTRVTIDGPRKSGRHARSTAVARVDRPIAIAIRVSGAPKQRVDVSWGLSCPKTAGGTDRTSKGGGYTVTPPNVRALRLPKRKIAFCAVNAQAQLQRSGRVRVAVLASER